MRRWPRGPSARRPIRCSTRRSGSAVARRFAFRKGSDVEPARNTSGLPRASASVHGRARPIAFRGPAPQEGPDMTRLLALVAATAAVALAPAPAAAQDEAGDRVNTVIVYGEDECPQSTGDEIVVCARMEESERYRIPEALRQSSDPANEPWASKVLAYEAVGSFGPLSCSS